MKKLLALIAVLVTFNSYAADDSEAFQALVKRDWDFRLVEFPYLARNAGPSDNAGQITHVGEKDQLRRYEFWKQIKLELSVISCDRLEREECINYRMFGRQIHQFLADYETKTGGQGAAQKAEDDRDELRHQVVLVDQPQPFVAIQVSRRVCGRADAAQPLVLAHAPENVGPREPVLGRMGITVIVRVLVVDSVDADPLHGSALTGHAATARQEVLEPLGGREAAVCQQPVVTQRDPKPGRYPY